LPTMTLRKSQAPATPVPLALRRWLGAALLGVGCLSGLNAHALSLGRLQVLSSLGESLRAEVEVLDFSPADVASLKASLVGAETAKVLGIDTRTGLGDVSLTLQRLPDGRATLLLTGTSPVTEPFVELALEVSWAAGKLTRSYTLLLIPAQATEAVTPLAPALQAVPIAPIAPAAPVAPDSTLATAPARPAATAASPSNNGKRVTVKRGDTAGQLALQAKALNVSLDQMLLAMLRSNPDAFVANNVNRLKAGAELALPGPEEALALDAGEARQTILLQSQDFNAFRQQLASNARPADVAPAGRTAAGKVLSAVEEKTPAAASADKLTLSKGALQSGTSAEEKLSQQRKAKDADERLAELSKNIRELSELDQRSAAAASQAQAAAGTPAAQTAASTPVSPALPAIASIPAAALPAAEAPAGNSPNLIDRLAQNDAVLPAAGALLSLLLVWIVLRSRRKPSDPASLLTAVQDDRPEPAEPTRTNAPMSDKALTAVAHAPSAALAERDPLRLAREELARGRDLQAEALLRMALEQTPQRTDMLLELMDLCVERQDSAAFEALAVRALEVTGGSGPDWPQICLKGQLLDPTNPLYAPTEAPTQPSPFANLDFDLELDAGNGPAGAPATQTTETADPATDLTLDTGRAVPAKAGAQAAEFDMASISLDLKAPPTDAGDKPPHNAA
jgi:pilus assembly protein FimV